MKVASISDLVELGWNRKLLLQIAHAKGSPAFKTPGGGKWMFNMDKFDQFVESRFRG